MDAERKGGTVKHSRHASADVMTGPSVTANASPDVATHAHNGTATSRITHANTTRPQPHAEADEGRGATRANRESQRRERHNARARGSRARGARQNAASGAQAHGAQPSPTSTPPRVPLPFDEAIDISDHVALRKRLRRNLMVMRVIAALLLIAAIVVAAIPAVLQWQSSYQLAQTAATSAKEVAGWPYPQAEEAFKAARDYNARLAQSGQPVLGEAVDPFSALQGGSQASGKDDSAAAKDQEYQSLLDAGSGIMGTIRVPKQSISLPIYHGTSEEALNSGAGHLYGTSLPVGGPSSHSVITGHRGLVNALMFTRLDEMRKGDFFYVEVMGETLAYEVDRISVILPDDTSQLKITAGEDRMTLMTCTPYGVNTHRLLVSGHRVAIPLPAPEPDDLHDARNMAIATGVSVLAIGWFGVWLAGRRQFVMIMRHAAWWPDERRRHAGARAGAGARGGASAGRRGAGAHEGAGAGAGGANSAGHHAGGGAGNHRNTGAGHHGRA